MSEDVVDAVGKIAAASPVAPGEVLDGKYRVDKVLGVGGMGIVVAATHVGLDRRVAIKFLLPEALQHPEVVARFDREARAAATVKGRHVVHIIDVGKLPDGRAFMVMEYLEGEDLDQALERRGALPVPDAVGYILHACEALAEAHAAGIVHRDLKPANLFLAKQPDRRSIIKVLDFGISKVKDTGGALTKTATAMGTPFYMSPEQLMNAKDVDARADIWSLGVILFELISNKRPFEGESMPEIVAKILQNERPLLRTLQPDLPPMLEDVIARCLRSDRSSRFDSVATLAHALGPFAGQAFGDSVERISRVLGAPSVPPPPGLTSDLGRAAPIRMMSGPPTKMELGSDLLRIEVPKLETFGANASLAKVAVEPPAPRAEPSTQMGVSSSPPAREMRKMSSRALLGFASAALVVVGLASFAWMQRTRAAAVAERPAPPPSSLGRPLVVDAMQVAPVMSVNDAPSVASSAVAVASSAVAVASSAVAVASPSSHKPRSGAHRQDLAAPVVASAGTPRSSAPASTSPAPPPVVKDPLKMDVK
jgi:eukaryotic-like serine/threonine-protein kinase